MLNDGARLVQLENNALRAHIGALQLNEGLQELSLARNELGEYAIEIRLPESVRRVNMRANGVDETTTQALRRKYPEVTFDF